jgi:hypothetical protein
MMVSPRLLKGFDAHIGTRIMSKWILTAPLFLMTIVGNMVDLIKKMGEAIEKSSSNLKESLGLDYQMHP